MTREELLCIKGGMSAAILNAIIRTVNTVLEIGRMVGSSIKRKVSGKYAC